MADPLKREAARLPLDSDLGTSNPAGAAGGVRSSSAPPRHLEGDERPVAEGLLGILRAEDGLPLKRDAATGRGDTLAFVPDRGDRYRLDRAANRLLNAISES